MLGLFVGFVVCGIVISGCFVFICILVRITEPIADGAFVSLHNFTERLYHKIWGNE